MGLRQEVSALKSLMEIDPKAVVASLKGFVRDSMENLEREGCSSYLLKITSSIYHHPSNR